MAKFEALTDRKTNVVKASCFRKHTSKSIRKVITFVIMDMQNSGQTWCMLLNRKSRTFTFENKSTQTFL